MTFLLCKYVHNVARITAHKVIMITDGSKFLWRIAVIEKIGMHTRAQRTST